LRAQANLKQDLLRQADSDVARALPLVTDPSRQSVLRAYKNAPNMAKKQELLRKAIALTPAPIPLAGVTAVPP